ncbi:hypothetical protein, partial [Escherichia coli]
RQYGPRCTLTVMPGAATLDQHGEQIRQEFSS